ncbi:MAG: zinc-ribbon domain-containing protein [Clostridiaceae bacterium]
MNIIVMLLPLIVIIAVLTIFILIGVYVYKDANSRGMNGLLWAIVAMFAPSFIGIIVYLIVRENYASIACSNCGAQVKPGYNTCPNCGSSLKERCENCGAYVEPEFKVCPNCAHELSHQYQGAIGSVKKKSSNGPLIALLVVLLIIPILVVVAFLLFMIPVRSGTINFQEDAIEFNEIYDEEKNIIGFENENLNFDRSFVIKGEDSIKTYIF